MTDLIALLMAVRMSCDVRTVQDGHAKPETFATVCVWIAGDVATLACRQVAL